MDFLLASLLCLVGIALVVLDRWTIAAALAAVVFAWGTITFTLRFLAAVERGDSLWFDSHWGGLGGGVSGFRLPRPWLLLLAAVAFGLMLTVVVVSRGVDRRPEAIAKSNGGEQPQAVGPGEPGTPPPATGAAGSSPPADGADAGTVTGPPGVDPGGQPTPTDSGGAAASRPDEPQDEIR